MVWLGTCSHDPARAGGDLPRDNPLVSVEVLRYDYKRRFCGGIGNIVREPEIELEILLKMNLPDHRSVLTDPEDQAKMEMETPRSSGVNSPPNAHT
ncbi:hypothetical protein Tco_0527872 [Tanacetum coccineum]